LLDRVAKQEAVDKARVHARHADHAAAQRLLVEDGPAIGSGGLAGRIQLHVAEVAAAAGNHKRHHHAVTPGQCGDASSRLHHFAHEFVVEDVARVQARHLATVEVQVGTADGGGGDAQDDVVGFL